VRQPLTATVSPLAVADRRSGHSSAQLRTRSDALEITLRFLRATVVEHLAHSKWRTMATPSGPRPFPATTKPARL
jgi:hypothetical protein